MSRVAIATCRDLYIDEDTPLLLTALADYEVIVDLVAWDDPTYDWSLTDLVVIRSTWDYTTRVTLFRAWVQTLPRVLNSVDLILPNTDKHYLADLSARGIPTIPTVFADVGVAPLFPDGDFVVKPTVGAGSKDAARYSSSEHAAAADHVHSLHANGRDAIVQPYVDSVDTDGEFAYVVIDGSLSHVMRKGAMLNQPEADRSQLFRVEQMSRAPFDADAEALAHRVLATAGATEALYARVDLCRWRNEWVVMELELTEPSLFLTYDDRAASRLAAAIAARIGAQRR